MMRIFAFGLGYSALHWLRSRGLPAAGTVTSPEKAEALRREGIDAHVFDGTNAAAGVAEALAACEGCLVSIGPDQEGDPVLRALGPALEAAPRLRWIGYLSTIGVYGDHGGGWVDEETPPDPSIPRAGRRIEGEAAWLALGERLGASAAVFRLAGIYGPGRNALRQVAAGTARRIVKPGQVFNRIHVEDIARTLDASLARPRAGAVYNVTDDEPAPQGDVVAHAAGLLGVEPPPEIPFPEPGMSPMALSFWSTSKRVRNRRIKEDLGVSLAFPTYREGLRALFEAGEGREEA